ncbi:unnamed protein product [Staurois parvus]|uniref:Uncharacterized protein n=1 Tax=Staurois parvus TaxID=386267 RepID=A0ABN9A9I7_9NEOB|nr:unnamed protein product [Staurois parvus]
MFCYVKFVWKKMSFFKIFKFPAAGGRARTSRRHRDRNTEAGCWHRRRRWPGTLQGTHRGSAGQGKCGRDSLCSAAWYSRV